MSTSIQDPHAWTREDYRRDAEQYVASLPLEHFMEATPQAFQREVTMGSFMLMPRRNRRFHFFNELMMHLRLRNGDVLRVVPDNMVVIGDLPEEDRSSYAVALEPCPPFWTLEYVSDSSARKDYRDNFERYETDFQVPYHLIFDPQEKDLHLYQHNGTRYVLVQPNAEGRLPIPQIEMEVAILDGWVRFWHRGELLLLPAELQERLDQHKARVQELEENLRQHQETIQQQCEALQEREEAIHQQREALQQREEAIQEQREALQQRDEAIQEQREALQQRDEAIHQQREALQQREEAIQEQREAMKGKDDQLLQNQLQTDAVMAALRPLVEARARGLGRDDILTQLPSTTNPQQLTAWLTELS